MKLTKLNLLIAVGLVLLLSTPAQSQYVKTLGGNDSDNGGSIIQISDGGVIVLGSTATFGAGGYDILLTKFDSYGNFLWTRTLGGGGDEGGCSVIEAFDGGLVIAGYTPSFGVGDRDFLLAKFDSTGNYLWARTLGKSVGWNTGRSVVQTSDGGLVMTGYGNSFGAGSWAVFLAKFDSTGNHLWTKALGGSGDDKGIRVIETSDGGLVVTGTTNSFGAGNYDLLLAKFDASGNHLWTRIIGGNGKDEGSFVIQTSDWGFVVAGYTESFGAGSGDLLVVKFDSTGNYLWARTLGGAAQDRGYCVIQASDGGLVVTGWTYSFGAGEQDLLISKFDALGTHLWIRVLGGIDQDEGASIIEASNDEFVVAGRTKSFGAGDYDLLLARFDADGNTCLGEFITPDIDSVSPDTTTPSPSVTSASPTITSPDPTVTSLTPPVTVVCDDRAPTILSITDVGNDQGRQVRVEWYRCYFDSVGSPVTITEYSLWRRIDGDRDHSQSEESLASNFGILDGGRLYPPGDWDFIKTVPARGEEEYNTVCPTLGDSTEAEGMYWSVFFVSAMTPDPLVYFDSEPDSGYSLDNIPPLPIRDLLVDPNSWFTLQWTVPGEYVGEHPISNYDIRYDTIPVGPDPQAWWDSATACAGEGFFNFTVGEADSLKVAKDCGCHPHVYFAIKGLDDRPNYSEISNIVKFICGDATGDFIVNVGDLVYLATYLFQGGPPPKPMATGDVTCDGVVNVGDLVYLATYLFQGGPPPCSP